MSTEDDLTLGEIGRRLSELTLAMRGGFSDVNSRLDRYVLTEVHSQHRAEIERRLSQIEQAAALDRSNAVSGTRWGVGTVLTGLAALASLVLGIIAVFLK